MTLRRAHQLLGLTLAALWLIQIVTGVLLTFRQEIDNFLVGGTHAPLNVESMGQRIGSIQAAGGTVASVWVFNFTATRFDILYADREHHERKMRVDGTGRILRDGPAGGRFANGAFFQTLTEIHTTLLVGEAGRWIIAGSGLVLLSNLVLGLKLAWPRKGYWRRSLALRTSRNAAANFYGLHRTLGLYIGGPLLVLVAAGILLCFADDIQAALHLERDAPARSVVASRGVAATPAKALTTALARFPGATLTSLSMPNPSRPFYRVQLRIPGEVLRMYGQTTIYLSARDCAVAKEYSAVSASPARLVLDWIYPLHTAELGGVAARGILVLVGVSLLTMGFFGIRLWYLRRPRTSAG
jgi:uncharacterized iron-regulated membrane protein